DYYRMIWHSNGWLF
nr:immunoglobulin light chain junction region [Macaca mulatta]